MEGRRLKLGGMVYEYFLALALVPRLRKHSHVSPLSACRHGGLGGNPIAWCGAGTGALQLCLARRNGGGLEARSEGLRTIWVISMTPGLGVVVSAVEMSLL